MAQTAQKIPTRPEFEAALSKLKQAISDSRLATAKRDEAIRKAQEKYQPTIDECKTAEDEARVTIQEYSAAHRNIGLLPAGSKSVEVAGVSIGWKLSTPALVYKDGFTEEQVMVLVRKKLPECIRKKEELDKTLLKAYLKVEKTAKKVDACGLEIKSEEKFFADPQ